MSAVRESLPLSISQRQRGANRFGHEGTDIEGYERWNQPPDDQGPFDPDQVLMRSVLNATQGVLVADITQLGTYESFSAGVRETFAVRIHSSMEP